MGIEPKPHKKWPWEMTQDEKEERIRKIKYYSSDELYLLDRWDEYAHTISDSIIAESARKKIIQIRKEKQLDAITVPLLSEIKKQYRLDWHGSHGIIHWHRVYTIGIRLSNQENVKPRVVQLFSVLHDACRKNENQDPEHGTRAAQLARKLRQYCPIGDEEFGLLTTACELHTKARNHDNITVQACFDADRLDLGRVGNRPHPDLLCTPMAKEPKTIEWAYHRSAVVNELPDYPFGLRDYWD